MYKYINKTFKMKYNLFLYKKNKNSRKNTNSIKKTDQTCYKYFILKTIETKKYYIK